MATEIAAGFAEQTRVMGLIGTLSIVAYVAGGLTAYLKHRDRFSDFARDVGGIFSQGDMELAMSAAVAFWQAVVLIPYGRQSNGMRAARFVRDHAAPLYMGFVMGYMLAWTAKEHIPFLGDEVSESAGKASALFLITVLAKVLLLISACFSSEHGESFAGNLFLFSSHALGLAVKAPLQLVQANVRPALHTGRELVTMVVNQVAQNPVNQLITFANRMGSLLWHAAVEPVVQAYQHLHSTPEDAAEGADDDLRQEGCACAIQ